jgi:hypothetical protein
MPLRRIYSNNNTINYNDYNSVINGSQMYKNLKSKGPEINNITNRNFSVYNNQITQFLDYQTFLKMTRSYFRQYGPNRPDYNAPSSIIDGTKSFISYKQLLSHIKDCDYCCHCKKITQICDCKEAKNILFPYGNFVEESLNVTDYTDKDFKFPIKLQLFDLCSSCNLSKCDCQEVTYFKNEVPICNNYSYDCNSKSCSEPPKTGCIDKCKKKCIENSCNNCCNRNSVSCINNIYPSQNQFMFYKTGNNNYDQNKRMNAYSVYPQISKDKYIPKQEEKNLPKEIFKNENIDFGQKNNNFGLNIYPQINKYACYNNSILSNSTCNPCKKVSCCENRLCGLCDSAKPLFSKRY